MINCKFKVALCDAASNKYAIYAYHGTESIPRNQIFICNVESREIGEIIAISLRTMTEYGEVKNV